MGSLDIFSSKYILLIVYLAFVPGFIGHTGINAILKYIAPVVISVTLLMEPVIGSFIGYFFKQSGIPGIFTFLGGPVIIAGCVVVTVSAYKRTQSTTPAKLQTNETTNQIFDAENKQNVDESPDENFANEEEAKSKVRQTTKYEKLREDVELDIIASDSTITENESK